MKNREKSAFAYIFSAIIAVVPAALIFYFSNAPYTFSDPGASMLKLSIKHAGKRVIECEDLALLKEEAESYRKSIRDTDRARMQLKKLGGCSRERHPVRVVLFIDGEKVLDKSYAPVGWEKDGPSFVYDKFFVRPGAHMVAVDLSDSGDEGRKDYTLEENLEFRAGRIMVLGLDEVEKRLVLR